MATAPTTVFPMAGIAYEGVHLKLLKCKGKGNYTDNTRIIRCSAEPKPARTTPAQSPSRGLINRAIAETGKAGTLEGPVARTATRLSEV